MDMRGVIQSSVPYVTNNTSQIFVFSSAECSRSRSRTQALYLFVCFFSLFCSLTSLFSLYIPLSLSCLCTQSYLCFSLALSVSKSIVYVYLHAFYMCCSPFVQCLFSLHIHTHTHICLYIFINKYKHYFLVLSILNQLPVGCMHLADSQSALRPSANSLVVDSWLSALSSRLSTVCRV